MAKRQMEFSLFTRFRDGATAALRRFSRSTVGIMQGMTRRAGLGAGFAGIGAGSMKPGGAGGILSGIMQGAAGVMLLPARIISGFAQLIPGIGGILGGVVSSAANILQGLVGIVANVVGGMLNAFGALLKGVASIFGKVLGAGFRILGKLPKILLLVGGAAAGANAALFAFVNGVARAGDEIAKMSVRTGLSIGFLSEMRHVLELNDAEMGDLQKAVRGVGMALEGATRGAGEYIEIFQRLGVSVRDSRGQLKSSEQLFVEIADALKRVENPALRAGMAQRIFGKAAANLLPTIMSATAGIAEMREESRRMGLTWDREASRAAVDFRDNLTRVQNAFRGLRETFLKPFLRPFGESLRALSGWLASHKDRVKEWGESASAAFEDYAGRARDAIKGLWDYLSTRDWKATWQGLLDVPKQLLGMLPGVAAAFADIGKTIVAAFKVAVAGIRILFQKLWDDVGKDFRASIARMLAGVAGSLSRQASEMTEAALTKYAREAYESRRGAIPGVKVGPKWEELTSEQQARQKRFAKVPLGERVKIESMQAGAAGITALAQAFLAPRDAEQKAADHVKRKEDVKKATDELNNSFADLKKNLGDVGGQIGGIARGALPAGKAPERIEREREEGLRARAERFVRGTPQYQATERRAERKQAVGEAFGRRGLDAKAQKYFQQAKEARDELQSFINHAVSIMEHMIAQQEAQAAAIAAQNQRLANIAKRVKALGTSRL